jgi:ribosomal protein S18 acetylase RimI-like enzyme
MDGLLKFKKNLVLALAVAAVFVGSTTFAMEDGPVDWEQRIALKKAGFLLIKGSRNSKTELLVINAYDANKTWVGTITGSFHPNPAYADQYYINNLLVPEEHREQGIASALLSVFLKNVSPLCKTVYLIASPDRDGELDLDGLVEFYKKRGFKKIIEDSEDTTAKLNWNAQMAITRNVDGEFAKG